ncbi:9143_t:CDS:1, partial [Acaulospora morrowiae]
TEVMREIIKLGLNYGLHVSWDKLNISTFEDTHTFTLERKTKTPLPPLNTP